MPGGQSARINAVLILTQEALVRAIAKSSSMLTTLGLLAAAGICACSVNQTPDSGVPRNGQATSPAATASAMPAATKPAGAPSATTEPGAVQNLAISSAEKTDLTAAYAATYAAGLRVPVSDLGAPAVVPGSVYYAYDPATDTFWAMADFEPMAPFSAPTAYMDGTSRGLFKEVGPGPWQVTIPINPDICVELRFFPSAVLTAWSLSTAPPAGVCQGSPTTTAQQDAMPVGT